MSDWSGRAFGVLVARMPGLSAEVRGDLLATARDSAAHGSRAAEIGSLLGLLLELSARRQTRGRRSLLWLQGALAGLGYALAVAALPGMPPLLTGLLVVLVPCAALKLARFDPRAAVAALVFWAWRLSLVDLGSLVSLETEPVARWCAMSTGVALAWYVTRRTTTTI